MKEEPEGLTTSWWPELVELIEYIEAQAAQREGRATRPSSEICAAIEREWFWRLWRRQSR
jgi:hypothetical protein